MHQSSPVRKWVRWRMRYITGSRICMFSWPMSIRARSTLVPSANSPARIRRSRSRLSAGGRSRHGLSAPGSVKPPRLSDTAAASWSST